MTCSGEPLAGDVVYQTVGGTANTAFLRGSGIPTDARGFIKVRSRLYPSSLPWMARNTDLTKHQLGL